jgi:hypothetical protein
MSELRVESMTRGEVDEAMDAAAREGWNPGLDNRPW